MMEFQKSSGKEEILLALLEEGTYIKELMLLMEVSLLSNL